VKITADQWSQLRRAAFDDDPKRFEALAEQIVRERIREHQDVVNRPGPGTPDGRPYLYSQR
jgi:hypothetical protein